MKTTFRRATDADITLLREFESRLVAHERSVEATLKSAGKIEYYDIPALVADTENVVILIAEIDGQPAGCGLGQIKANDSYYNETHYGYIGLMYVGERHRGQRLGQAIMNKLMKWFREKGLREVHLKVYASNERAVRAYEKFGFVHYVHEMKIDLT